MTHKDEEYVPHSWDVRMERGVRWTGGEKGDRSPPSIPLATLGNVRGATITSETTASDIGWVKLGLQLLDEYPLAPDWERRGILFEDAPDARGYGKHIRHLEETGAIKFLGPES
jgi:hypothetical protein